MLQNLAAWSFFHGYQMSRADVLSELSSLFFQILALLPLCVETLVSSGLPWALSFQSHSSILRRFIYRCSPEGQETGRLPILWPPSKHRAWEMVKVKTNTFPSLIYLTLNLVIAEASRGNVGGSGMGEPNN